MSHSTADLMIRSGGVAEVTANLRLTGDSYITCCTYPDRPAILALDDPHIRVSVTVPGDQVTAADLDTARRLADAVAVYVADLQARITTHDQATGEAAA